MIDSNEIMRELIRALDNYRFPRKINIGPSTELHKDLGIYGVDFMEILMWVEKRFGISIEYDSISRYCPPDPDVFIIIIRRFLLIFGIGRKKLDSLNVSDLVEAIQNGRWPALNRIRITKQ